MIRKILDLSTAHVPGPTPDFGDLRVVEHEFGWIVFVSPGHPRENLPSWIDKLHQTAIAHDCILINFDQDSTMHEEFQLWDW